MTGPVVYCEHASAAELEAELQRAEIETARAREQYERRVRYEERILAALDLARRREEGGEQ